MSEFPYNKITSGARKKPSPGGYICTITDVEKKTYHGKDGKAYPNLLIYFDISEGDYSGYFTEEFRNQNAYFKKWKGIAHLNYPEESDSSQSYNFFKKAIKSIEKSNEGYSWNGDENSLVGKTVGIVLRAVEWAFEDRQGWRLSPYKFVTPDEIRAGSFEIPEPKYLPIPSIQTDA